jgi:hypothetical protein
VEVVLIKNEGVSCMLVPQGVSHSYLIPSRYFPCHGKFRAKQNQLTMSSDRGHLLPVL